MIESLDTALAKRAAVEKAKWEEVCPDCFASYSMHTPECPQVAPKKKRVRREKKNAE